MTTSRPSAVVSRLAAPAVVAGVVAAGCAAVWFGDPTTPGGVLPVCPLKALTGLDCPGCGGLRMAYSLMHGDVLGALRYNAVGLVAVGFLAVCFVAWTASRWRGESGWNPPWLRGRTPAIIAVVFVAWFVIRLIPIAPFTALRV
ncbi:Protein of uncharacterised function (DUF2752) [Mycobacteroides abscessus subsp. bolletii]|uniref:DUF2752 domain-containing protein n=1 Tax=Mycobacteroides abscessus TaxID=36809 RepID=UPI000929DC7E|nr:DUF2752 domain-containing protein [Mycobacteroides abscessus]SII99165.1 Protein of uncharacterised function (DUF2752) [Mycobacteroides abscessus subsp. bolletii]SLF43483.1 Protein of uncharacterised function (DUF2752) [Mycobacteroides abscessus subsp. bolletii]